MMATEALCDFSDLPVTTCAHCTGDTLVDPIPVQQLGTYREAQFPGTCGHCGRRYGPGTDIALSVDGDWNHVECTRHETGH